MRISRRSFIGGMGASALTRPARASSGCIMGAIRWDAYYGSSREGYVEGGLGPSFWQSRAPWFSQVTGPNTLHINGNLQANIDLELQAANAAGVKFWAYDWYPTATGGPCTTAAQCSSGSGFMNAWQLHQNSAYANLVPWAFMYQDPGGASAMSAMVSTLASYMAQSNYLKVSGRPVFFFLADASVGSAYAAPITALRAAAQALGTGNPYIVALFAQSTASAVVTCALAIGADEISNYSYFSSGAFASVSAALEANWTLFAAAATAAGLGFVPNCCMGGDRRPQFENNGGIPWANNLYYTVPGTNAERVAQAQAAINFIVANPSACPTTLGLIYAWNEQSEGGGGLGPTLGDPPSSNPPYMNSIETALSAVLP
jgi:hypothetical protein